MFRQGGVMKNQSKIDFEKATRPVRIRADDYEYLYRLQQDRRKHERPKPSIPELIHRLIVAAK
jgi:hypothetical protein